MGNKPISVAFLRRSSVEVARDLVGCILCKQHIHGHVERHVILETEAYLGENDLASHARFGKTKRNAIMYREAGVWYTYLCYGMHILLNIVTDRLNTPSAVLIRGIQGWIGPGKLTKHLQITMQSNGMPCHPSSGLWIEKPLQPLPLTIVAKPRVGVNYAGPIWAQKEFRFIGTVEN